MFIHLIAFIIELKNIETSIYWRYSQEKQRDLILRLIRFMMTKRAEWKSIGDQT